MEFFKTVITFSEFDEGFLQRVDTIWYKDAWWLVATAFEDPSTGRKIPDRLVRLTGLPFQEVNELGYRFFLGTAIPISVFEGQPCEGYVVEYYPALSDIQEPTPGSASRH